MKDDIETRALAMRDLLDTCPEQPPPIPNCIEAEVAERALTGFSPESCPCMICEFGRRRRGAKRPVVVRDEKYAVGMWLAWCGCVDENGEAICWTSPVACEIHTREFHPQAYEQGAVVTRVDPEAGVITIDTPAKGRTDA